MNQINYRYTLRREIAQPITVKPMHVVWAMLNPSTANDMTDDMTISKIREISKRHSFTSLEVVNLFAARATDPRLLDAMGVDAIGPENDMTIERAIFGADAIVVAWGSHGNVKRVDRGLQRAQALVARARLAHRPQFCCGVNADGSPKHPCRLAYSTPLVPYLGDG